MAAKIGEIQIEITADVKKTEALRTILRITQGAETTSKIEFNPAEDLKKGDKVKITIEKV
jgi:hypothetical protein